MKLPTLISGTVILLIVVGETYGYSLPIQDKPDTSAANRLNQAGPESAQISSREGLWDVTETYWPAPGAEPVVTTGLVADRHMEGSLLQEFIRPVSGTAHHDVRRTDLLTFNRLEGRWQYVSFDARAPVGLMPAYSTGRGDSSKIELFFTPFAFPRAGKDAIGQFLRMDQVILFTSPDSDQKDQYFTLADGSGTRWLAHRYAYVRRGK